MEHNKQKLKRKNLVVGWTMAVLALALYIGAIYYR